VKLASVMAAKGLSAQVHVRHFHKWAATSQKWLFKMQARSNDKSTR
jgi:hypothetical protein